MANPHLTLERLSLVFIIASVRANFEFPSQKFKPRGSVNIQHVCLPISVAQPCPDLA